MDEHQGQHGYLAAHKKDDQITRLRRIEGQVRGLQRMVEPTLLHRRADPGQRDHEGAGFGRARLLDDHLGHCVAHATYPDADGKVNEASEAIARLVRS